MDALRQAEREPEARGWAVHSLGVKNEGESVLRYFDGPQVRQELRGAAQLTRWP
ncbi:hypothetical protein [Pontibacter kalidii]|uniref:hypothetical protein n=1 Tax=Pontibacter kalidii TaxID=2592049 RepID=UPI002250D3A5|nr:hypothetical protein [Pontibacter kalidii]